MDIYVLLNNLNKLTAEQLATVREAVTCCSVPQGQRPVLKSSPACLEGAQRSPSQEQSAGFPLRG